MHMSELFRFATELSAGRPLDGRGQISQQEPKASMEASAAAGDEGLRRRSTDQAMDLERGAEGDQGAGLGAGGISPRSYPARGSNLALASGRQAVGCRGSGSGWKAPGQCDRGQVLQAVFPAAGWRRGSPAQAVGPEWPRWPVSAVRVELHAG